MYSFDLQYCFPNPTFKLFRFGFCSIPQKGDIRYFCDVLPALSGNPISVAARIGDEIDVSDFSIDSGCGADRSLDRLGGDGGAALISFWLIQIGRVGPSDLYSILPCFLLRS